MAFLSFGLLYDLSIPAQLNPGRRRSVPRHSSFLGHQILTIEISSNYLSDVESVSIRVHPWLRISNPFGRDFVIRHFISWPFPIPNLNLNPNLNLDLYS
jgi:hypothetical protein